MADKRKFTFNTDVDVNDILARAAEANRPDPENQLRLERLNVQHKLDHGSLTIEQVKIIGDLADSLIAENTQREMWRQEENTQTRAVLRNASDELVDRTVQTPWERHRSVVEGGDDA